MKYKRAVGLLAALLVLGFLSVALVVSIHGQVVSIHGHLATKTLLWAALSTISIFGVVTLNYVYPKATAPAAADVYGIGLVCVQVNCADSDTSIGPITHSFGLSAQELIDLFPVVIINPTGGATAFAGFTFTKATNTLTINKSGVGAGSGGSFDVIIMRPHTNQGGPLVGKR